MTGEFVITGNSLSPAPDAPFVAIKGSAYHNGVYSLLDGEMIDAPDKDETFDGVVYPLRPPDDFLALCKDISAFDDKSPVGAMQSETFGGYSYTRASGANGGVATWQNAYASRLIPFKRMFSEVM